MATPLKSASSVFSRIISPRSPNVLNSLPKTVKNTKSKVVSRLFGDDEPKPPGLLVSSNISIKIDKCEDYLLLNSPMRLKLLKSGTEKRTANVLHFLGKGSFGTVLKGNYKDQIVAVKVVKLEDSLNERQCLHLSHKNVVKIFDVIESANTDYALILMELFEHSNNLQTVIDNPNFELSASKIICFSIQVCAALEFCHKNDILHLDIKPKNILVCGNAVKICDFGNCMRFSSKANYHQKYTFKGTVPYTSPEILLGSTPTSKSDVFSFGILLWQMMARKNPYEFMDNEVVIYKVVKFNFRPSMEYISENMGELGNLCIVCWQQNFVSRPEFSEIFTRLNNLL